MKKRYWVKVISSLCSLALVAGMFGVGLAFAGEGDDSFTEADLSSYNVDPTDGKVNKGPAPFDGSGSGSVQGTIERQGMWMLEIGSVFCVYDENGKALPPGAVVEFMKKHGYYVLDKDGNYNDRDNNYWFTIYKKGISGSDGVPHENGNKVQQCISNVISDCKKCGINAEYIPTTNSEFYDQGNPFEQEITSSKKIVAKFKVTMTAQGSGGSSAGSSSTQPTKRPPIANQSKVYPTYTADKWVKAADGRWWIKDTDGSYPTNKWATVDGKWYRFDNDGWMQTGWIQDGGKWYRTDDSGAMQTGWVKDGPNWYLLHTDGAMATGWHKDGNTWYRMNNDGVMQVGWFQDGDGKWYWMNNDGAMIANATVNVDGVNYRFDKDGAWVA